MRGKHAQIATGSCRAVGRFWANDKLVKNKMDTHWPAETADANTRMWKRKVGMLKEKLRYTTLENGSVWYRDLAEENYVRVMRASFARTRHLIREVKFRRMSFVWKKYFCFASNDFHTAAKAKKWFISTLLACILPYNILPTPCHLGCLYLLVRESESTWEYFNPFQQAFANEAPLQYTKNGEIPFWTLSKLFLSRFYCS